MYATSGSIYMNFMDDDDFQYFWEIPQAIQSKPVRFLKFKPNDSVIDISVKIIVNVPKNVISIYRLTHVSLFELELHFN